MMNRLAPCVFAASALAASPALAVADYYDVAPCRAFKSFSPEVRDMLVRRVLCELWVKEYTGGATPERQQELVHMYEGARCKAVDTDTLAVMKAYWDTDRDGVRALLFFMDDYKLNGPINCAENEKKK